MEQAESQKYKIKRFGATVLSLCVEHGVVNRQKLVELLRRKGYTKEDGGDKYSHTKIGNWLYGKNAVDRHFCFALVDVLDLDEVEKERLADAFTFGQDEEVDLH